MRRRFAGIALGALLAPLSGVDAFAQDTAPAGDPALTAKVDSAIAGATSYRIAVAAPAGLSIDIREFGPDRVKITTSSGGATTGESIVVGTAFYYRDAGGQWKAYPVPPVPRMRRNRLYMGAPDTLLTPLADRSEGGETYGAFRSVAVANGQLPGTMDCTYDKVTFRPRSCSVTLRGMASAVQVSYAAWDDPANAVEPPPGIDPPVPLPPPGAAPTASPGPKKTPQ